MSEIFISNRKIKDKNDNDNHDDDHLPVLSHIVSLFQGMAIGDAFAVGLEMKSRYWILENVDFTCFLNEAKPEKETKFPYSDDTEHFIGTVKALLEDEHLSKKDAIPESCRQEYEADMQKRGFPRKGHGSIERWYKGEKTLEEVRLSQSTKKDPGNAPIMRSLPFSLLYWKRDHADLTLQRYALLNADATHPHPQARLASYLLILAGRYLLSDFSFHQDESKEEKKRKKEKKEKKRKELIGFLQIKVLELTNIQFGDLFLKRDVMNKLFLVDQLAPPDRNKRFVLSCPNDYEVLFGQQPIPPIENLLIDLQYDPNVYGLPCSSLKTLYGILFILKHAETPFEALQMSVNMGGDVDSLAAICVAITSFLYGNSSLPPFLAENAEGMEKMADLAALFHQKFF